MFLIRTIRFDAFRRRTLANGKHLKKKIIPLSTQVGRSWHSFNKLRPNTERNILRPEFLTVTIFHGGHTSYIRTFT